MGHNNKRRTTSEILQDINRKLSDIDCELSELVTDAQEFAESTPGFTSHFTNDETGDPICVPEDACPELDGARVQIDEAIDIIRRAIDGDRCLICDGKSLPAIERYLHDHACPDHPDSFEEQRADLQCLQLRTLRDMARERGITVSGTHGQLVERLIPIR